MIMCMQAHSLTHPHRHTHINIHRQIQTSRQSNTNRQRQTRRQMNIHTHTQLTHIQLIHQSTHTGRFPFVLSRFVLSRFALSRFVLSRFVLSFKPQTRQYRFVLLSHFFNSITFINLKNITFINLKNDITILAYSFTHSNQHFISFLFFVVDRFQLKSFYVNLKMIFLHIL